MSAFRGGEPGPAPPSFQAPPRSPAGEKAGQFPLPMAEVALPPGGHSRRARQARHP